ncbi:MAG: transposase, partial [Phycisphaerae bacterium]|nr:transposase [Phycisphaerae bacterium]
MKRKNPYSLIDVNDIDIAQLSQPHIGQAAVVGVDVAKHVHVACVVWPDRRFERPWRINSPKQVGLFIGKLLELRMHCPLKVAMESSGTYGDALRQALGDAGIEVVRVSAKAVKDQAETFDGVPSQHDGKDAAIVGTLCLGGHGVPWPLKVGSRNDQAMRYWVRKLDTASRIKQVWCGKLESMLARHWPEASELLEQSGATLLNAMSHWGDPRKMAADPQTQQMLAGFGGHYLAEAKIGRVLESARGTIGVRMNDWAVQEMREIAEAILQERKRIGVCRRKLKTLSEDYPAIRSQAAAVGLITACVLWMCLGDPCNYGSAGAYRKAMGLNLKERSSGLHKGKLSLSKRGARLARKWLYFSALRWMKEPGVKLWMERKKQRD